MNYREFLITYQEKEVDMARNKKTKRPESISGGYSSIPWIVLDSQSFIGATDKAKALLWALIRQHNGQNNGHLHLAKKWLYEKGWTCHENNSKARDELIERGLIQQTKWGGLNAGPDFFAVTWLDITNYIALDIGPRGFERGAYSLCNLPPTKRRPPPKKKSALSDSRYSSVPVVGIGDSSAGTTVVSKKITFRALAGTTAENNVFIPLPLHKSFKRIVGIKGKSGIPKSNLLLNAQSI